MTHTRPDVQCSVVTVVENLEFKQLLNRVTYTQRQTVRHQTDRQTDRKHKWVVRYEDELSYLAQETFKTDLSRKVNLKTKIYKTRRKKINKRIKLFMNQNY